MVWEGGSGLGGLSRRWRLWTVKDFWSTEQDEEIYAVVHSANEADALRRECRTSDWASQSRAMEKREVRHNGEDSD